MNWKITITALIGIVAGMICNPVQAETRLSGAVSGRWEAQGSPFTIIGDITLGRNDTLRIDPGVSVVFQGNFRFTVNGKLLAEGLPDTPIVIQGSNGQPGSWRGIFFVGAGSDRSHMSYCTIRYAYQGINLDDADPTIDNCAISFCSDAGVSFSRSLAKVLNCQIFRINGTAVKIGTSSRATVRACSIATCQDNGIVINESANPVVSYNYIADVSDHGIHLTSAAPCSVMSNVISNAGVRGISVSESNGAIIVRNVVDRTGGPGAYFYRSVGVEFINNTILWAGENGVQISSNVSGNFANCIVEGSDQYGILMQGGNPTTDYNDVYNNADGNYHGIDAGQHDMSIPSTLDGNYNPQDGNALVDAGDPFLASDPDGTRADIGAGFLNQNRPPVIRSFLPNWSQDTTVLSDTVLFSADVVDPDGHFIVWKWFVNGVEEWRNTIFNRIFSRNGEYTVRLLLNDRYYLGETEHFWHFFVEGSSVTSDRDLPEGYYLGQVYPNPFNAVLNLELRLPHGDYVEIELLDMNGRSIRNISSSSFTSGEHRITFDASDISAGSYLLKADVGVHTLIRRTVLLK